MDDVAPRPHAAGFLDVVGGHRENRAAIDGAGGDEAFFALLAAARFAGDDLGMQNNIKHGVRLQASGSPDDLAPQFADRQAEVRGRSRKPRRRFCYAARHGRQAANRDCGGGKSRGRRLAVSLRRAGYAIEAVIARSRGASLRKAQRLAKQVGARALTDPSDCAGRT